MLLNTITITSIIILYSVLMSSCINHSNNTSKDVNKAVGDSFVADKFENRDDTASFNVDKGDLNKNIGTLDLSYAAISCPCAQWVETKFADGFNNKEKIYLESATNSLVHADSLFDGLNLPVRILVTGQFYSKKGYPKDYRPAKGSPETAKVFRYTKIKILQLGGKKF